MFNFLPSEDCSYCHGPLYPALSPESEILLSEISSASIPQKLSKSSVESAKLLESRGYIYLFPTSSGLLAELHPSIRIRKINTEWNIANPSYQVNVQTGERIQVE